MEELQNIINIAFDYNTELGADEFAYVSRELIANLNSGNLRSAEPMEDGSWHVKKRWKNFRI